MTSKFSRRQKRQSFRIRRIRRREMWRIIFITLLGLASAPAWSAGKQCSLDAKTMFTFTWVPQTPAEP
ncbi:MAG: hypothetical protein ABIQ08_12270, partial [Duganella sp.]